MEESDQENPRLKELEDAYLARVSVKNGIS